MLTNTFKNINTKKITIIISIIYLVGLIGLILPESKPFFQELIPVNIFLSFLLVLFFQNDFNKKFIFSIVLIFLLGFFLEVAGVATGAIFGAYYYQSFLGPKVFNVPLLIGFNWFLLVYCASSIFVKYQNKPILFALLVASFMLVLDIALEFFAIKNNMWIWTENGFPPIKNFIAWFSAAFIFTLIYSKLNPKIIANRVANSIFYIMFLFFLAFDILTYFILKQNN